MGLGRRNWFGHKVHKGHKGHKGHKAKIPQKHYHPIVFSRFCRVLPLQILKFPATGALNLNAR